MVAVNLHVAVVLSSDYDTYKSLFIIVTITCRCRSLFPIPSIPVIIFCLLFFTNRISSEDLKILSFFLFPSVIPLLFSAQF